MSLLPGEGEGPLLPLAVVYSSFPFASLHPFISAPVPSALPNPWWHMQWQSRSNLWLSTLHSCRASEDARLNILPATKISAEARSLLCHMCTHYSWRQRHIAQAPRGSGDGVDGVALFYASSCIDLFAYLDLQHHDKWAL